MAEKPPLKTSPKIALSRRPPRSPFLKILSIFYPQPGVPARTLMVHWFYLKKVRSPSPSPPMIFINHHFIKKRYIEKRLPIGMIGQKRVKQNKQ